MKSFGMIDNEVCEGFFMFKGLEKFGYDFSGSDHYKS